MKKVFLLMTLIMTNIALANTVGCIQALDEKIINLKSNSETVFKLNECSKEEIDKEFIDYLSAVNPSKEVFEFSRQQSSFTEIIELLKSTIPDSDTYSELRPITDFWSGTNEVKPADLIEKGLFINNDGKNENFQLLAFFYTQDMSKVIMISRLIESVALTTTIAE